MQTDTHGVALVCERHDGHTVAWVDAARSRHVPAGYFVETWPYSGMHHAGTLAGGYALADTDDPDPYDRGWHYLLWFDWYDAVLWCRYDDRQRRRKEKAA